MVNACQKGKRVERDLANWLKLKGCSSARRSSQHCGKPTNGTTGEIDNSDIIVPDELPNWHIESKATKSPSITCSKLKSWIAQIRQDCPAGKLSVILNVANGWPVTAIMTSDVYKAVALQITSIDVCTDASFDPAIRLAKLERGSRIYSSLMGKEAPRFAGMTCFEPEIGICIAAVNGSLWIEWALAYEKKLSTLKESLKEELQAERKLELVK